MDSEWFPLRVTYNREMKMKAEFEALNIECFVPMHYKEEMIGERRVRKLAPSIHNLIFVHISEAGMKELRNSHIHWPIRYIMNPETRRPLIVPDEQMQSFMTVAGHYEQDIVYLDVDTSLLKKGSKVRVMSGDFKGAIGTFLRVMCDLRVVVSIPGVAAVATAFVHPSQIEIIEE